MTEVRRGTSRSAAETEALGARLAPELRGGDVILLEADLAAGKTTLVRGLVAGLQGNPKDVSSPTFILIQSYVCNSAKVATLHHVDLYRLGDRVADLREIGIEDIVSDGSAVTAVEWPKEAIATWIPVDARLWRITIAVADDDTRTIVVQPPSSSSR